MLKTTFRQRKLILKRSSFRFFIFIDYPTGEVRIVSGYGDIEPEDVDNQEWNATGELGEIRGAESRKQIVQSEVALVLSQVRSTVEIDPTVDINNRRATIYIGAINERGRVKDGLIKWRELILTNQTYDDDGQTIEVSLIGNDGISNLGFETNSKVTTAFQKARFPNIEDTGLSDIPLISARNYTQTNGGRRVIQ